MLSLLAIAGFLVAWMSHGLVIYENKLRQSLLRPILRRDLIERLFGGLFLSTVFAVTTQRVFIPYYRSEPIEAFVKLVFLLAVFTVVYYLSVYDYKKQVIPAKLTYYLSYGLLIINIVLLFIIKLDAVTFWVGNLYQPVYNLVAGATLSLLIWTLVYLSKEKWMGAGDIRLALVMGLMLGFQKITQGFYITIFSATIVGVLYGFKLGRFKNVPIPFVPFLALGLIVPIVFWEEVLIVQAEIFRLTYP